MALQKAIPTLHGIDAAYHKITKVEDDRLSMQAYIHVAGYAVADYSNKTPILSQTFVAGLGDMADLPYCFSTSEIDPEGMNHIERAYLALKTLDIFQGAEDI